MLKRICKTGLAAVSAGVLAWIDQIIKIWACSRLRAAEPIKVIPGLVQFNYVENYGAAFNILNEKRVLLIGFSLVMSLLLLVFLFMMFKEGMERSAVRSMEIAATVMILAGAVGNFIDRLSLGYVIDYIQVLFIDFPVFNMADCLIVVGGILLVLAVLLEPAQKKEGKTRVDE